ncbi:hypothetical protein [Roseiflexus sp.]
MLAGAGAINLGFPPVIVQLLETVLQQGNQTLLMNLTLALIALFLGQAFLTFLTYTVPYDNHHATTDSPH